MRTILTVSIALACAACSRGGGENLGLDERKAQPAVDVHGLARPDELLRALAIDGAAIDRALGARAVDASSSLKIEPPGAPAENLDETWRLETDGRGAVRVVHDNSHGYGSEQLATGGELFVRPRYGHFVKRRPELDEVARLRAGAEGVAADYLSLVGRWLKVSEAGGAEVAGRRGLKLTLGALPQPSSPARDESDPARKWRQSVQVKFINGEVVVDAASGALLSARFETSYTFERDGKGPFAVTVSYKMTTDAPQPIAAPADAVASPERPRPMLDRQALLDGLPTRPKGKQHD